MFERLKPGRLLVELIVVVLGVGIALAADSWREDRELRARELAYLRAIEADTEKAAGILKAAYAENIEYAERIEESLALLHVIEVTTDKDGQEQLVYPAVNGKGTGKSEDPLSASEEAPWEGWEVKFSLAQFSVPTGTLQALIASGDLGLILSEELRATLVTEFSAINTYQSWIDQASAQALPSGMEATYEMEVLRIQAAGKVVSLAALRNSPRLTTSYLNQLNLLGNILTSMRSITASMDRIHQAVQKELEQRGG